MKIIKLAIAGLAAIGLGATSAQAVPADQPPNVVVFLADDLGWADVGYHGSEYPTPNIDSIAEDGVRLNRFYTNPKCTPTRAAMLTGRDPITMGVEYSTIYPWEQTAVPMSEHFMSESFQENGYQTAMFGKWHLGHSIPVHTPNNRGFDYFFGHLNTNVNFFEHTVQRGVDLQRNGKTIDVTTIDPAVNYGPHLLASDAVRWLKEDWEKDSPFFMYIPFKAPHTPLEAPESLIKKFDYIEDKSRRTYAAMVYAMDQGMGWVMDEIKRQGAENNTIVLFYSDNGGVETGGGSNFPLKGQKGTAYEGGIRVVSTIKWPGVLPENTVSNQYLSAMDLFPSLANATNIAMKNTKPLDGEDFWDNLVEGTKKARSKPLINGSEDTIGGFFHFSVTFAGMKLVQQVDRTFEYQTITNELYNLNIDPNEQNNIAQYYPVLVESYKTLLNEWRARRPWAGGTTKVVPQAGWRAPLDWAKEVELRGSNISQEEGDNVFGFLSTKEKPEALKLIDELYGERGRLIYE
ncbi:arylsulfatase B [Endozoicomonas arenosclerae]|uniref:arylsulfatase B n=1 Tax=Endozoicomonas arenosclerae TaxID=1633495 RepID=UPI00078189CD|nr:arylsulfatase [Endozoicomonas arenosclerae]